MDNVIVAAASVEGLALRTRLRRGHSSDRSASLASAIPESRSNAWGRLGLGSGCFAIQRLINANCRSGTRTWTLLPVREGGLVFFIPHWYHWVALASRAKVDVADGPAVRATGPP